MTETQRIARIDDYRRLHDNVVRIDEARERRAPQKWYELARAGQLVRKDMTGAGPDVA